jgi:hypothetical protein
MKLVMKNDWRRQMLNEPPREFDIDDAVEMTCEDDYGVTDEGALERTQRSVKETGTFMGRLVQKLHDKGVLEDDDVLWLVGEHQWRVAGDAVPADEED